jgi:uncharacterized protein (TIGR02099 family)
MKHLSDSDNPNRSAAEPDLKPKSVWQRVVYGMLALVVLGWMTVLLAWSALHIFIVPRIDDYRGALQQQASRAMGLRVEIGSIQAGGGWWVPWFEINDVQLFDRDGRQALLLPRVLAAISPRSVLRAQFEQIDIDSPELEIRKDAQGHVWIAGLDTTQAGDGRAADWVFSQPQWVVRQGVVHWRDESRPQKTQNAAPVLTLQAVEVSLVNHWFGHDIRADFTPPETLGQRLSVQGKFQQTPWLRAGDLSQWSGEVFADLPFVDLATLRQWVPMDKALSLQEGRGALRVWSDIRQGEPVGITADVALDAVQARLGADLLPLSLRHVHGRVGAQWGNNSVEISTQDLVFDTQEGEHWPGGVLRVSWTGDAMATGALHADRLDLEALAQISQRLPLPDTWRAVLARAQPQGQVNQLKATWQRLPNDDLNYSVHGQVRQLHVKRDAQADSPLADVPGMQAAQLIVDLNQSGGKAQVTWDHGSLTLPFGLEQNLIALDDASVQLAWQRRGSEVAVQFNQGRLANADLAGEFSGSWKTGAGEHRLPGVLDLTASISRANLTQVHRYLPDTLPVSVRRYVRDALLAGEASQGAVRLRGDLNDMPFENPKLGEFRMAAQVAKGHYVYVLPDPANPKVTTASSWPTLKEVAGELVFDRNSMVFKGQTQLAGAPSVAWQKVEARIADLSHPVVQVSGEARGPLTQVLQIVTNSALNDLTGSVLSQSQATGDASYKLALNLPLEKLQSATVKGSVTFANNSLQVIPGTPVLQKTRGTLAFSDAGIQVKALQAQLLGGDATLDGALQFTAKADAAAVPLQIKGEFTAEGLRQAQELGWVSQLAQQATGKAAYTASLGLRLGKPELLINSNLKGIALNLPAPLNKTAAATLPLRIESQLTRESLLPRSRVLQEQIKVTLERLLSVVYVRDLSSPRPRVLRGGIAVGPSVVDTIAMRDNAVSLIMQLPTIDLDAWDATLTKLTGVPLIKNNSAKKTILGREAAADDAQDYLPHFVALQAEQMKVADRLIHNVLVGGSRQGDLWRMNISAEELNGAAEIRPAKGDVPAQLFARLAYLNIPPSSVSDVERMLSEQPSNIPTLDIVVADLTLRGKKLGRLEIDAVNRVGPKAGREWRLNKFNISVPEATLTAHGSWMVDGPRLRRTQFNFGLAIRDSGELLARLGTPGAVRGGEGRLDGEVSWQGSPLTLDFASMTGQMKLAIEKGQFLKTDPGAARLLGVLNLQALPRRLTLDFSDLFSDGFAFDFVRGDIRIEQGVALTNNLQMKGVVAGALIEGSADLVKETQKLKVVVVPEINAGTASLYMATINPLVGLTSYLAQSILSKPLVRAGTTEFQVDGTWADPRVTKID